MIRYGDDPAYDGTIVRGTTEAVMSQPNAPAGFVTVSVESKCSIHPLEVATGDSSTPMYTSPFGPIIGEAVPLVGRMDRLAGVFTSRRSTRPATVILDAFDASRATRYPLPDWPPEVEVVLAVLIATYTLLPSVETAGALFMLIVRMVVSPVGARLAAVTMVACPAASMRARPRSSPPPPTGSAPGSRSRCCPASRR